MLDRSHIEQLLKLNGVEPTAPDEEIKSILLSARWHNQDVETALLVLRENTESMKTHVDTLHKVFHSDDHLHPETIAALLGVSVDITRDAVCKNHKKSGTNVNFFQVLQIALVSVCCAFLFIVCTMWYMHIGPFDTI